nr:Os08g0512801 [Ipomoea batatas]
MLAAWALNPPRAPAMADPVRFLSMLSSTKEATSVFSTLLTTSSFIMASQTTDLPRPSIQLTAAASSGVQSFDVGKSVEAEVTAIGDLYFKMTKQQCHRLLQCRQPPRPPSPQPPRESHDVSLPSSSMEANNGVGLWLLSGEAAVADRTMRNMDKD